MKREWKGNKQFETRRGKGGGLNEDSEERTRNEDDEEDKGGTSVVFSFQSFYASTSFHFVHHLDEVEERGPLKRI